MKLNFPELAGIYTTKKKKVQTWSSWEVQKMHTTDRVLNGRFERCEEEGDTDTGLD